VAVALRGGDGLRVVPLFREGKKKCPLEIQGARRALLAPRISRGHFFLTVFLRVTHGGPSERGTTRSLIYAGLGQLRKHYFRKLSNSSRSSFSTVLFLLSVKVNMTPEQTTVLTPSLPFQDLGPYITALISYLVFFLH